MKFVVKIQQMILVNVMAICFLVLTSIPCAAQGIWCDWFGIGCPKGGSNQTFIDLGRSSTNQGFLFFDGDSARIKRTIEFTFSDESINKRDKVILSLTDGLLPNGSKVFVNDKEITEQNSVSIVAESPRKNVQLVWIIPPTGQDVKIDGSINLSPVGFERMGNLSISPGQQSQPIPMLRIQGEIKNDWHWSKRLTFWFFTILLSIILFYKFFLAPVFLHRRFDLLGLRLELFEEGKSQPVWSHDFGRRIRGARRALIGQKVPSQGLFSTFMKGRVSVAKATNLPNGLLIEVDRGKRKPMKGKKIQVKYGAGLISSIFENSPPNERKIYIPNSKLSLIFHLK